MALLGGIALAGGGFDLFGRHIAAILSWTLVIILLWTRPGDRIGFGAPFRIVLGLLGMLTLLTALSLLWSSSEYSTIVELDRLIAYIGFLTATFLVCRDDRSRRLFIEGLLLAFAIVLIAALADRLFPGTDVPAGISPSRLSFPLGYWNANGLLFGISIGAFAWASRESKFAVSRWTAVALIPAAIVGLYFTYSRGGAVAGVVMLICLFFLNHHRLWMITVVLIGGACAAPVIRVVHSNPAIADNLGGAAAPSQGHDVLVALAAAMVAALLICLLVRTIASKVFPGVTRFAVAFFDDRRFLGLVAVAGVIVIGVLAATYGERAWDRFSGDEIYFPDDPKEHFTQLSGAGRYQFNQVAVDAFRDNSLLGTGAGTYRYEWASRRTIDLVAQDAHSLYLENFSELGIFGGLIILAFVVSMVWICVLAFRRSSDTIRPQVALIVAMALTLFVSFSIDWFWELAATAALLMMAAGWLTANLLSNPRNRPAAPWVRWVAIASAWVAIVGLTVPAISDRYMQSSIDATADLRLKTAVSDAQDASRLAPYWARPHMQLGVLAQYLGLRKRAMDEFTKAIELEPDNWQTWYLRATARQASGKTEAANRDFNEAKDRNPRAPELQDVGETENP